LPQRGGPVEFPARPVPADPYTVGLSLGEHGAQVPDDYLLNESAVRLSVLQGMLDAAAGPITQAGRSCRAQYPTASKQVRADVLFLVHSLGGIVNVRTRSTVRRATGERRESYVLDIRLPEGIEPFRREQNAARHAAHGGGRPTRVIHSIDGAGAGEAVCIRVAAPGALYATEDLLLTHTALAGSFIILAGAQTATA